MNPAYGPALEASPEAEEGNRALAESRMESEPDADVAGSGGETTLSARSQRAIVHAMGKDTAESQLWGHAFLRAGFANGIDPNILVGVAARESGLRPDAHNGSAKGIFQVTPQMQATLGLATQDLSNPNVVVDAVAGALSRAKAALRGDTDLAVASWTAGLSGVKTAYKAHGISGVRGLLLDAEHPSYGRVGADYIDFVNSFRKGSSAEER